MFGKVMVVGFVIGSFVPVFIIFWNEILEPGGGRRSSGPWWTADRWAEFAEGINSYVRVTGTMVGTLIFLAIAVRGAGALSAERDRQSLDTLLTTPLSASQIVWGKWWGCLLGMRWAWVWLGTMWLLGLMLGGIHPIMVVPFVVSTAVYASGFAWIGLYCSVTNRTTMRAMVSSIALSVLCGGGYWLVIAFCCCMPISLASVRPGAAFGTEPESHEVIEGIVDFFCCLSPSVNLFWLPVGELKDSDLSLFGGTRGIPYVPFWMIGLVAWGLLSFALSQRAVARFERVANRVTFAPEFPPPSRTPPPLPPKGTPVAWPEGVELE